MNSRRLVIWFSLLWMACISYSQEQRNFVYTPIDTKNGLSENRVRYILQLPDGRMVICTEGLTNIYDGSSFKHIHPNGSAFLSLKGFKAFHRGYVDSSYVWIKYLGKLMMIDIRQERYVSRPDSVFAGMGIREPISDFYVDGNKNYWILTASDNLLVRDAVNHHLKVFRRNISRSFGIKDDLYDIAVVQHQVFLIFRSGIIQCCDLRNGQELYHTNTLPPSEEKNYNFPPFIAVTPTFIYQLRGSNEGKGLVTGFDIRQRKAVTILKTDYWLNTPSVDRQGNLWVSCAEGLWIINPSLQQKQFTSTFKLADGTEISSEVSSQFHDAQGGLWVGTFNRGLLYYHPDRFKFRNIDVTRFGKGVKKLEVNSFTEGFQQNILVGTSRGIYNYFPEQNVLSSYPGIPADAKCISLLRDSRHRLWLCTDNKGLFCIYKDGVKPYTSQQGKILRICETEEGKYLAATDRGFGYFDTETDAIRYVKGKNSPGYVSQLISLGKGRVLGRANTGLFIYNFNTNQISGELNELLRYSNQQFNCLFKDSRNRVWIGTQDGLSIWLPGSRRIHTLYAENGLVNNSIKGIEEDKKGYIWVTTAGGVSRIGVKGQGEKPVFSFANFNHYDGVLGNEFTSGATYLTERGVLLLGGVNGLNLIDLQSSMSFARLQKPLFTNLMLFGNSVKPGVAYNGNTILESSITTSGRIVLNYNQNFIGLEFSALNYVNPTQTYFRYRLEGVDKDWREVTAQNGTGMASYTNLSPGTYRLMVKSANNSKEWSDDYAVMIVEVKAPYWQTIPAYLLYMILTGLMVYFSLKYYRSWTQKNMVRKNEEKLNGMKFNFFTNISHEFRTPLTLIITPLESVLKDVKDAALEPRLRSIYRHARDLQGLVNQLLDFRRLEVSGEKLNLSFGNIVEFNQQFEELFSKLAQEKGIDFSVNSSLKEIFVFFDKEKLYRILNNLLSNAFKFTPSGGRIAVSLTCPDGEHIRIEVMDSGKGIPEDELPYIFDRFYQAAGAQVGSGIGLHLVREYVQLHSGEITVTSQPGRQTCFTVILPLNLRPENVTTESENILDEEDTETHVTTGSPKRYKLLVVEDNEELRNFLVGELSRSYEVVAAADGEEGREMARTTLPDLIISDVMMPKKNGLELCRELKTDLQTSHIPVILLTARASEGHKLEGYEAGADEYLPKPFNLDVLLLRISKLIEQQSRRHEQFNQKVEVNPKEITITPLDKQLIEKALECIERNMDNTEFSVQQFSEEMGMDRTVLYKKLQNITGLAPSEFIRSIRLKRAARLLVREQLSVTEVMDRVGFNTYKYFAKYFREAFGVPPSQYAQSGKDSNEEI